MELGGHGDDRGRFLGQRAHGFLGRAAVGQNLGQGAVVADGAGQDKGHAASMQARMMPSGMRPSATAAAMDPASRHALMASRWW
jgi:hypothetical protein